MLCIGDVLDVDYSIALDWHGFCVVFVSYIYSLRRKVFIYVFVLLNYFFNNLSFGEFFLHTVFWLVSGVLFGCELVLFFGIYDC